MRRKDAPISAEVRNALHFTEAHAFSVDYRDVRVGLKSPITRQVCEAFVANLERVKLLAYVPQATASSSVQYASLLSQAVFTLLGRPVLTDDDLATRYNEIADAYAQMLSRRYDFFEERREVLPTMKQAALQYTEQFALDFYGPGYRALLAAQVISAWTAFDTLTTDLWVAVVNLRAEVATRAFKEKSFTIERLQKHGFTDPCIENVANNGV